MIKDNLSFFETIKKSGTVAVLGVPIDLGKDTSGTHKGPEVLRKVGIASVLKDIGFGVNDLGDVECPIREQAEIGDLKLKYLESIVRISETVAKNVSAELKKKNKVLVLGGDNTVSLGSLAGAAEALGENLGVIWIDAHGDINTHETTMSGNIHGMPIAAALGLGEERLVNLNFKGRKIKPENLVYVGLKDLDQAEIDIIREKNISFVTMLDISEQGLASAFEKIRDLAKRVSSVWVCLDVDSIDKEYAPATPMATGGGLNYRESLYLAKFIGKVCEVSGVDVSEFAPDLDNKNKTATLVVELVANYFGGDYSWYTRYMEEERKKQTKRRG